MLGRWGARADIIAIEGDEAKILESGVRGFR